jgi:hypothetical protein
MGIAALIHPLISLHWGWYPPLHRGWYNRAARKFTIMLGLDAPTLIARLFVLLTAFAVHEFAHAWTANRFGDDTPRLYGRLTLNPLAHLDVMGSLMLIFVGFGWAKPVPVNAYYLERRSPAALMWVSLAGPLSNLLMAVLAAIPFQLGLLSVYDAFGTNNGLLPTLPYLLFDPSLPIGWGEDCPIFLPDLLGQFSGSHPPLQHADFYRSFLWLTIHWHRCIWLDFESGDERSLQSSAAMSISQAWYRTRQFWLAWRTEPPSEEELAAARSVLTTEQMTLFLLLQPSEQIHALRVLQTIQLQGESDHDLQTAALLHDIGKARAPLKLWERVVIVFGKHFFPQYVQAWGSGEPRGWKRPFVIAEQHPAWGGEMAAEAISQQEDRLLSILQAADQQN